MDFGPMLLSNTSQPSSRRSQSRGSYIRCTPTNIISPPADIEKASVVTSGFLNQAHHMDMFGSHFKVGGIDGLEDSATPAMNADLENEIQKIPPREAHPKENV